MEKERVIRLMLFVLTLVGCLCTADLSRAQTQGAPDLRGELEKLRERMEALERETGRKKLTGEEEEERRHYPLVAISKTHVTGGLTMILQGTLNNEEVFGGDRADGSMSADLFLESEIAPRGTILFRMDVAQGTGLTTLPPLFVNPDGTPTGPNNDVEGWSSADTLHINEVRYEQYFKNDTLRLTVGQIDLTSYFDENEFANKETFQFIAPLFNNNIAIDWGGNANFFGPGVVFNAHPIELLGFSVGLFEGDGDYQDLFSDPFIAVQVELEPYTEKLEGHYRFFVWTRRTSRPSILDPAAAQSGNSGVGVSFDQELSRKIGVWGRFGTQRGKVAQFDRHASAGVQFKGAMGREEDVIGAAFGATFIGGEYKQASGLDTNEYYGEVYYNAAFTEGVHFSPDLQYIVHPGGNGAIDPVYIYGLRGQISF